MRDHDLCDLGRDPVVLRVSGAINYERVHITVDHFHIQPLQGLVSPHPKSLSVGEELPSPSGMVVPLYVGLQLRVWIADSPTNPYTPNEETIAQR